MSISMTLRLIVQPYLHDSSVLLTRVLDSRYGMLFRVKYLCRSDFFPFPILTTVGPEAGHELGTPFVFVPP